MNTPADHAALVPDVLTRYEQLRCRVLDPGSAPGGDFGLTLLQRRGMAAWARQQPALLPHAVPPPPMTTPAPLAAQAQLTGLLVAMLIGSIERQEITAR